MPVAWPGPHICSVAPSLSSPLLSALINLPFIRPSLTSLLSGCFFNSSLKAEGPGFQGCFYYRASKSLLPGPQFVPLQNRQSQVP